MKTQLVRLCDILELIRTGAAVLRDGGSPESAAIYEEVANQLDAMAPEPTPHPLLISTKVCVSAGQPRADLDKTALLSLCKEHIAQYRAQGMSGKAEAIEVLVGELS